MTFAPLLKRMPVSVVRFGDGRPIVHLLYRLWLVSEYDARLGARESEVLSQQNPISARVLPLFLYHLAARYLVVPGALIKFARAGIRVGDDEAQS